MTLKQERLIEALTNPDNNSKSLNRIGKEVGYSEDYAKSGLYQEVRNPKIMARLQKAWSKEAVQVEVDKATKLFKKAKDNSNYARMLELKAKAVQLTKENNLVQVNQIDMTDILKPKTVVSNDAIA